MTTAAPAEARTRYTLYNFLGKERAYYLVDRVTLETPPEGQGKQAAAHSIIIVDRSGSMYSHVEEYAHYGLLVTLISYSSQGNLFIHFQRVPIRDVMARGSRCQQEIKKIRATALTGMSQALQLAVSLVRDGEPTGITLHTDGFANDPSPASEAKNLDKITEGSMSS